MKPVEDKDYVQSLERGLAVILAFSDKHPRLSIGQLAELTGLSRPTVRRLVLTLVRLGYVRDEGRTFALTPHVLALGYAFTSSLNLSEVAQPRMEEVTEITGHTCSLAALDGEDAVFLLRVPPRRVMRHLLLTGTRLPAFASAIGRVLLAGLPPHEIESFVRQGVFHRLTATTETDPATALMDRIDTDAVAEALESLPTEYRVVSTLYFIEDFSYQQIGASQCHRAGASRLKRRSRRDLVPQERTEALRRHPLTQLPSTTGPPSIARCRV